MENYFKVTVCTPRVWTGDVPRNVEEHLRLIREADQDSKVIVFPELSLTGYTCGDLFLSDALERHVTEGISTILRSPDLQDRVIILGAPWERKNCALLIHKGQVIGVVGKRHLPEYDEFYEHRWFTPDTSDLQIFAIDGVKFGVEICEDLWVPCPPSEQLVTKGGAEVIINLSASPKLAGKQGYLETLLSSTSGRLQAGYVYTSAGPWESSGDLVFSGFSGVYENGVCLTKMSTLGLTREGSSYEVDIDVSLLRAARRKTKYFPDPTITPYYLEGTRRKLSEKPREGKCRKYNPFPFCDPDNYDEVFQIQSLGLQRRLQAVPGKVIVGVSGGTDSTLALLVAVNAIDSLERPREDIIGVTMPCFGTSQETKTNSWKLMDDLGIDGREINITSTVTSHLQDISYPSDRRDVTYENSQARLRTQTLFDLANMEGGIVLGTGDLSELALGWCTYGADHLSSYNPNVSVPKTLVIALLHDIMGKKTFGEKVSEVLRNILDTPISPELLPLDKSGKITQISESIIGPYELHDYFLYHTIKEGMEANKIKMTALWAFSGKYTEKEIEKWFDVFTRRFRTQQFKRSCLPDGPKTGSISLSPRGDWRMPSDLFILPWES